MVSSLMATTTLYSGPVIAHRSVSLLSAWRYSFGWNDVQILLRPLAPTQEPASPPALSSAPMIHFHNGDVAASLARRAGVPGRHVPFRESLVGGPVRPSLPMHEWVED